MSQEVSVIAIITPKSGKAERFKELTIEGMKWIKENEPETLQFSLYEEETESGTRFSMFERYASQAAMDKHEASENYKAFFGQVMKEDLIDGMPMLVKGPHVHSFIR